MYRPEYQDANGCRREGKATKLPWGNSNAKISVGLTKYQFKQGYENCVDRCAEIAPWYQLTASTCVKHAPDALTLLVSDHWQSNRTIGYSYFHHETVTKDDMVIASIEDEDKYGVPNGELFVLVKKLLKTGFKGDDGPMSNWLQYVNLKQLQVFLVFFGKMGH